MIYKLLNPFGHNHIKDRITKMKPLYKVFGKEILFMIS